MITENNLYDLMKDTMYEYKFQGIAAPIGTNKRVVMQNICDEMLADGLVDHILVVGHMHIIKYEWMSPSTIASMYIHGQYKEKILTNGGTMHCINPEGLKWLHNNQHLIPERSMLIIDYPELFKNPYYKRSQYLREILNKFERRYFITSGVFATEMINLYGQISLLDMGESLGKNFYQWRNKYFTSIEMNQYYKKWVFRKNMINTLYDNVDDLVTVIDYDMNINMCKITEDWLSIT